MLNKGCILTKIAHVALGVLLVGSLLLACRSESSDQEQPAGNPRRSHTTWFSDPREYITNDLSVAQAETPFAIVLPTYLPQDVDPSPEIRGRARSDFDDMERVTIAYKAVGKNEEAIRIDEMAILFEAAPSKANTLLVYDGTEVVELANTGMSFDEHDRMIFVEGHLYAWNRDGVHLRVLIMKHDKEEARKVVQSMVR